MRYTIKKRYCFLCGSFQYTIFIPVCPCSPSSLQKRADINRQDDHPFLAAGESSLSTPCNSEFNIKLFHLWFLIWYVSPKTLKSLITKNQAVIWSLIECLVVEVWWPSRFSMRTVGAQEIGLSHFSVALIFNHSVTDKADFSWLLLLEDFSSS